MVTRRRGEGSRPQLAVLIAAILAAVFAAPAVAAPVPTEPDFTGGESQPVFPTTSTSWINHELWIEAEVDSDNDGKKDLVHADVSRVQETDTANLRPDRRSRHPQVRG